MKLSWLEVESIANERIESLCCGSRRYLPSILAINRELRNLAICELEGKNYFEEKMKLRFKRNITTEDLITWHKEM